VTDQDDAMHLDGVREYGEADPVELVLHPTTGRTCIRAWNEGHNNYTIVDLGDLVDWLRMGPEAGRVSNGFSLPIVSMQEAASDGGDHEGD
jgi:hypothetical protein